MNKDRYENCSFQFLLFCSKYVSFHKFNDHNTLYKLILYDIYMYYG